MIDKFYTAQKLIDERADKPTEIDVFNALADVGATADDMDEMLQFFNVNAVRMGLPDISPEKLYYRYLDHLRAIEHKHREAARRHHLEVRVKEAKSVIARYKGVKDTENFNLIAGTLSPLLDTLGAIGEVISPKKVDIANFLKPEKFSEVEERLKKKREAVITNYRIGDRGFVQFPYGAYSIIAAPTGNGKTTFGLNLLLDVARSERYADRKHWFLSYEENHDNVHLKALNILCDFNMISIDEHDIEKDNKQTLASYYRGGSPSAFENEIVWERFDSRRTIYRKLVDAGRINIRPADYPIEDLLSVVEGIATINPGLIVIDYLQLLENDIRKGIARPEELKAICNDLKDIAVKHDLAIIGLSQFNREVNSPNDMRATRLGEGSGLEKASNTVYGVYKLSKADIDKMFPNTSVKPGALFIKALKWRDGQVGLKAVYEWDGNRGVIKPENLLEKEKLGPQTEPPETTPSGMQRSGDQADKPRNADRFSEEGWNL